MIRRPPRSTPFPTRRSSDLHSANHLRQDDCSREDREVAAPGPCPGRHDRKSTRLNSSHLGISHAVFCLKKKILQTCFARFIVCAHPELSLSAAVAATSCTTA